MWGSTMIPRSRVAWSVPTEPARHPFSKIFILFFLVLRKSSFDNSFLNARISQLGRDCGHSPVWG